MRPPQQYFGDSLHCTEQIERKLPTMKKKTESIYLLDQRHLYDLRRELRDYVCSIPPDWKQVR